MSARRVPWNRCDFCGRFIAMTEFDQQTAARWMETPDSEVSGETWTTCHLWCDPFIHYQQFVDSLPNRNSTVSKSSQVTQP